jgi:hypothetical protein
MDVSKGVGANANEATSTTATRATRRAKPTKAEKAGGKRSLNLRIDGEAYERLAVHALRRNTTISALVEAFAREQLREFHIVRNGRAGEGAGEHAA